MRRAFVKCIRRVSGCIQRNEVLARAITVVVVDWDSRAVDGKLFKVRTAMAVQLRIEVGVNTPLQERVVGKVYAADYMGGLKLIITYVLDN